MSRTILNWLDHVELMAKDNILQKIKRWKPMSKRPIGRTKTLWEDGVHKLFFLLISNQDTLFLSYEVMGWC